MTPQQYSKLLKSEVESGERAASELKVLHVRIEREEYDSRTGEKVSKPQIQMYRVEDWGNVPTSGVRDYLTRAEYKVEVLFDPREKKAKAEPKNAIEPEQAEKADNEAEKKANKRKSEEE